VSLPKAFIRNVIFPITDIDQFRDKYKNIGVYITAYSYNESNQDEALLYGDLYFDFDTNGLDDAEKAEENYKKVQDDCIYAVALFTAVYRIDPQHLRIYFSGKKGLHLIVPAVCLGVEPRKDLNEIYRFIVEESTKYCKNGTIDTQIYDRRRLLRLPGSKHQDTKLHKIPITVDELYQLNLHEIKTLAKESRTINLSSPRSNPRTIQMYREMISKWESQKPKFHNTKRSDLLLDYTPPCVQYLLFNTTGKGQRNNTAAVLISFFKRRGKTEEETYERMLRWNKIYCQPSLSPKEIEITVKSIYHGNGQYGCATLEKLSQCSPEKCKLARRTNGDVAKHTKTALSRSPRSRTT